MNTIDADEENKYTSIMWKILITHGFGDGDGSGGGDVGGPET